MGKHFLRSQWLTLLWRKSLSYRNQSIDLQSKSVSYFYRKSSIKDISHGPKCANALLISFIHKLPLANVVLNRCSLKNFAILIGKHLCWNLFETKFQASKLTIKIPEQSQWRRSGVNLFLINLCKNWEMKSRINPFMTEAVII